MAINILIPIDFSVESLNTLKIVLEEHKNEQVHVVLIYAQNLSSSITELLFHSSRKTIQSLRNKDFDDALNILKNSYVSSLKSFHIDLFHGSNVQAFTNFARANKIDMIYIPQHYRLQLNKNGFDPLPLIKKATIPFKEVNWKTDQNSSDNNAINKLFI